MSPLFTLEELQAAFQLGLLQGLGSDGVAPTEHEKNTAHEHGKEFIRRVLAGDDFNGLFCRGEG